MNLADIPVRLQSNALRIVGATTKDLGAAILGSNLLPYVWAAEPRVDAADSDALAKAFLVQDVGD